MSMVFRSDIQADIEIIRDSRLFDEVWYHTNYLSDSAADPIRHYIISGAFVGNFPNPLFDTNWYMEHYSDLFEINTNPLVHFAREGARKKLNPNPYFDTKFYLECHVDVASHPDIASHKLHPLIHYLEWGWRERRRLSSSFCPKEFVDKHPWIGADQDPLAYFIHQRLEVGHKEFSSASIKEFLLSGRPADLNGKVILSESLTSTYVHPAIEGISDSSRVSTSYGPVYVSLFPNVIVESGSDNVRNENTCYLSKIRHPFSRSMTFTDKGTIQKDLTKIKIENTSSKKIRVKYAFSLLGLHDAHWAHFLAQYFPKLNHLKIALSLEPDLYVLAPAELDEQARQMVSLILAQHGVESNVIYIDRQTQVHCEMLCYVDNPSWLADTQIGAGFICGVIPDKIRSYLKMFFDSMSIDSKSIDSKGPIYDRVYLRRNSFRTTVNMAEIDYILQKYNFEIVQPEELSLQQKISLFSRCRIIAGQFSSGFTNVIMCKPDTDILIMSNLYRLGDAYIPSLASSSEANLLFIPGNDTEPNSPDTNYHIDPNVLERALIRTIIRCNQISRP